MQHRFMMNECIIEAVKELNEEKVIGLTKHLLTNGEDPVEIINSIQEGMIKVGELYESKNFFIADLIMAGIIFKEVLSMSEMRISMRKRNRANKAYSILIGTVSEDLHDIGKEIFAGMASASGFVVHDIGVDVSPEMFLEKYIKFKPDIIGMSGVLTQSVKYMKQVVELFEVSGYREQVKIIIGGNPISKEICKFVGADGYSTEVKDGIKICENWMKETEASER